MSDALVVRALGREDAAELASAVAAMRSSDPGFTFVVGWNPVASIDDFLAGLERTERGIGLPPEWVPATARFAFLGSRLVGRVMIRHRLNTVLEREGGHIGYGTLPEFRRRGVATALLRHGLQVAHGLGVAQALLTCDATNLGSRRVIESCGGVLESVAVRGGGRPDVCRYRVATRLVA